MAGTTAFVWVLLGGCVVAVVGVIARAKVDIARIRSTAAAAEREPGQRG